MNTASTLALLLISGALLSRYPVPIPITMAIAFLAAAALLLAAARKQALLVLPFIVAFAAAIIIPLPLPSSWPPVIRLGVLVTFWSILMIALWYAASRQFHKTPSKQQ